MSVERVFEGNDNFLELLLPFIDYLIEEIAEKLYNENRVDTVMAHTSSKKECIEL
jgi:hypothetical protein